MSCASSTPSGGDRREAEGSRTAPSARTSRRRVDRPAANDEDAKCLSQRTFLLGEFRERAALRVAAKFGAAPSSTATAITTRFLGWAPTRPCSPRFGRDFELLDAGCCGIAGAFGLVKKHYSVSIACGAAADRARRR